MSLPPFALYGLDHAQGIDWCFGGDRTMDLLDKKIVVATMIFYEKDICPVDCKINDREIHTLELRLATIHSLIYVNLNKKVIIKLTCIHTSN